MRQHYLIPGMILLLLSGQAMAIGVGNQDDFEDETTQGWSHGPGSPNPPVNIPGGGDDGFDDNYLENFASGAAGGGGRQVMFNRDARWTGDWPAAGVNKVRVNIANFGSDPVSVRIAIRDGLDQGANCFVSTVPVVKAADALWTNHEFLIDASTMTSAVGSATFADVASSVAELRVLSSAAVSCSGDQVLSIIGYDDFQSDNDADFDGINDAFDNCITVANPRVCIDDTGTSPVPAPSFTDQASCQGAGLAWGQPDTDGDLYGNACDFDIAPLPGPFLSGDCKQNFLDLQALKLAFLSDSSSPQYNPHADFNFDGQINFSDFQAISADIFGTVGPGLGNCGCAPEDQGLDNGADFFVDNNSDGNNDIDQLFVRGGMVLDWGAVEKINNVVNLGGGQYQAKFNIKTPGSWGYKIADFDWVIEYGNRGSPPTEVGATTTLDLNPGSQNSILNISTAGCYQFDITVIPARPPDPSAPVPQIDLTVTGPN